MTDPSPDCGYTAPIPGRDPGACPDCGSWRKAGMIHECDDGSELAFKALSGSRRLLAHARACPAMHDGGCSCGAEEAAANLGSLRRALDSLVAQTQRTDQAFEEVARLREFGEHYSGAAQEAWDRIVVLETAGWKVLREHYDTAGLGIAEKGALWDALDAFEVVLRAGSVSPGGAET